MDRDVILRTGAVSSFHSIIEKLTGGQRFRAFLYFSMVNKKYVKKGSYLNMCIYRIAHFNSNSLKAEENPFVPVSHITNLTFHDHRPTSYVHCTPYGERFRNAACHIKKCSEIPTCTFSVRLLFVGLD